jgi:hypothetical protein
MKELIFIVIVLTIIASCNKKEPIIDNSPYWGEMSVSKNISNWVGKPYAVNTINGINGLSIIIDSVDIFNILRESISFTKIPLMLGKYQIFDIVPQANDSIPGAIYGIWEDDILTGIYKVLESDSSSFVALTSFDSLSKEVKGTFDLTFISVRKPHPSYPDTVRFRDGVFHTKLIR